MSSVYVLITGPYHCNDYDMVKRISDKLLSGLNSDIQIVAYHTSVSYMNDIVQKYAKESGYGVHKVNGFDDAITICDIGIVFSNGASIECRESIAKLIENNIKHRVYLYKDDWL